jgi:hypothetical protein
MKAFFSTPCSHPRPDCKLRNPALSGVPSLIPKLRDEGGDAAKPGRASPDTAPHDYGSATRSRFFDAFHQGHGMGRRHLVRIADIGFFQSPCVGWLCVCARRLASKNRLQAPEPPDPRLNSGSQPEWLSGTPALVPLRLGHRAGVPLTGGRTLSAGGG